MSGRFKYAHINEDGTLDIFVEQEDGKLLCAKNCRLNLKESKL